MDTPEAWFDEHIGTTPGRTNGRVRGIAGRIGQLFESIRHPGTGEPYKNADVARMSAGSLTEEVEGMRTGRAADPP
jgi:hypothetical protein